MSDDKESFGSIDAREFRTSSTEEMFKKILFSQISKCMQHGTKASTDRESMRRFERSVKMLESFTINSIDEKYQKKLKGLIKKGKEASKNGKMNEYYEYVRLRFIYVMRILSTIPDMLPEEQAIEVIK